MEFTKKKYIKIDSINVSLVERWGIVKIHNIHISEVIEMENFSFSVKVGHVDSFYCFSTGKKMLLVERVNNFYNNIIIENWKKIKIENIHMSNGNQYITIV